MTVLLDTHVLLWMRSAPERLSPSVLGALADTSARKVISVVSLTEIAIKVSTGKLDVDTTVSVVGGIAKGCELAGCALIGGETAEMPDMYPPGEYDLAGFCVGAVEKSKLIDGSAIRAGDVILGIDSSGAHSNGYSLIRRIYDRAGRPADHDLGDGTRRRRSGQRDRHVLGLCDDRCRMCTGHPLRHRSGTSVQPGRAADREVDHVDRHGALRRCGALHGRRDDPRGPYVRRVAGYRGAELAQLRP